MRGAVDDAVRFELLGPLRARRGLQELDLGPGKQRAVLATLLLAANRAVPPTQIVDTVWGEEPPENGTNVVQKYVAGLRRVLEPDRAPRAAGQLLSLTEGGYLLSVAPGNSDLEVFTGHFRQSQQLRKAGLLEDASRELQAALSLWRAEPLAGLAGSVFEATRERLSGDRASALEEWAEIELEQGRQVTLLPELSRLVAEFPLRERLRGVQMLALYRTGRQAEALAAFREVRRQLVEAHGVEPGADLQQLHNRLLQNDPTLSATSSPTTPAFTATATPPDTAPYMTAAPPGAAVMYGAPPAASYAVSSTADGRPRRTWRDWLVKAVVAVIPIVTIGLASAPLMAVLAIQRRSLRLGLAAVGYGAATVAGYVMVDTSSDVVTSNTDGLAVVLLLSQAVACSVHAAVITPRRPRRRDLEREVRRQQARRIAADHPRIARELGIGRPDLPNSFDDGGLVDINDAPVEELGRLPGVSVEQAKLIVADRTYRGRFRSVQELASRGLFPWPLPAELAEVLLIISSQDVLDDDQR
ncbi:MAG TPA: BTAD domain-containing putative transcriptional regulator [Kribbella sp.]